MECCKASHFPNDAGACTHLYNIIANYDTPACMHAA